MPDILIEPENILIQPDVSSREELFRLFYEGLYKNGTVKEGFYEALARREESYPTGLDTGEYKIAIPHTDADLVNKSSIGTAILKKPVLFGEMGAPHKNVEVSIVLLVMIKDNKAGFYHNLLNKIKNSDILHKIYNTDDRQDLCLLLIKLLNT